MKRTSLNIIYFVVIMLSMLISTNAHAQHSELDTIKVYAFVTPAGDTIPMSYLPDVQVNTKLTKAQKKYWAEWTRLRNAVYVTYPYAITASRVINDINKKLVGVINKQERKKIIKSKEKELKRDFADKITQLSVYQGRVLMKLINRQTGNNCYEIIDEYKGAFTAGFYQTIALIFGGNLKLIYEPLGKDIDMEKIVMDVQRMYGYTS